MGTPLGRSENGIPTELGVGALIQGGAPVR